MLVRAASRALDAMGAEQEPALSHASTSAGAVFLSYAAEDAAAAERIAVALRGVVLACLHPRATRIRMATPDRQA